MANMMAVHFWARIHLLHVIPPLPVVPAAGDAPVFDIAAYIEEMIARSDKLLKQTAVKHFNKELEIETSVKTGDPADVIVKSVTEIPADIIVIGTHGQTGWRRFISGSVTERVVRTAVCPVLTVRAEKDPDNPA